MEGKQGAIIGVALVALAGIGAVLIMVMGAPQSNSTAVPLSGSPPPAGNPNDVESFPPETSTAENAVSSNQSQIGTNASYGVTSGP